MSVITTKLPTLFLVIILAAAIPPLQRLATDDHARAVEEDDRYYLPPAGWLRAFSLGYTEAMADIVWVKTIIYFGKQMTHHRKERDSEHVMNYLLTAVALDPHFRSLYTVGSTFTLFQEGGHVTRRSLDMAIALLEKGTKVFPDDGEIFFSLGFMHHYEMLGFVPDDPNDPVTKEQLRLGRYYFSRAALMKGAPPYAALLSASLMEKWGMSDMVIAHLKAMLMKETDPKIRKELIAKLREEAGKTAEQDIARTEALQAAWHRELGFVPFDFYLFLRTETPVEELIDPLYFTDLMLEQAPAPSDDGDRVDAPLQGGR